MQLASILNGGFEYCTKRNPCHAYSLNGVQLIYQYTRDSLNHQIKTTAKYITYIIQYPTTIMCVTLLVVPGTIILYIRFRYSCNTHQFMMSILVRYYQVFDVIQIIPKSCPDPLLIPIYGIGIVMRIYGCAQKFTGILGSKHLITDSRITLISLVISLDS